MILIREHIKVKRPIWKIINRIMGKVKHFHKMVKVKL